MFIVTSVTIGRFMDLNGVLKCCVRGVYDTKQKAIDSSIKGMKDITKTELKDEKYYRNSLADRNYCYLYLDYENKEVKRLYRKFTVEVLITECNLNEILED